MSHLRFDTCPPDAEWGSGPARAPARGNEPLAQAQPLPVVVVAELAPGMLPALCRAVASQARRDTRVVLLAGDAADCGAAMTLTHVRTELARRGCAVPVSVCRADSGALAATLAALGPVMVVAVPGAWQELADSSTDLRPVPVPGELPHAKLRRSTYAALQMPL